MFRVAVRQSTSCVRVERFWLQLEISSAMRTHTLNRQRFSMQQTETTQLFADCHGMHTCPNIYRPKRQPSDFSVLVNTSPILYNWHTASMCASFYSIPFDLIRFDSVEFSTLYPANLNTALRSESIFR